MIIIKMLVYSNEMMMMMMMMMTTTTMMINNALTGLQNKIISYQNILKIVISNTQ